MKKVLILAIGCSLDPWKKMYETSKETWDSVEVQGVETIFYFGNPIDENTQDRIYFPIEEGYFNMGYKMLEAFKWALENKEFDYVARINGSCYVDKRELIKYIQILPEKEIFQGGIVEHTPKWMWGGLQFIISRDVIQRVVDNENKFQHNLVEDVALSYLITELGIPYTSGKGCSIDRDGENWRLVGYGGESYTFNNFKSIRDNGNFFYRVKQDGDRKQDEYLMKELYKILK